MSAPAEKALATSARSWVACGMGWPKDGTLVQPAPQSVVSDRSYYIVMPTGAPRNEPLQPFIDWLLTLKPEQKAR